jgi:hypothetical protein
MTTIYIESGSLEAESDVGQYLSDLILDHGAHENDGYGMTYGGVELVLERSSVEASGSHYPLLTPICIPNGYSATIRGVGNHRSAVAFEYKGTGSFAVEVGTGNKGMMLTGARFVSGGVLIDGGATGDITIDRCDFVKTKDWVVKTTGSSTIGVKISRCKWRDSEKGGIHIGESACDLWRIDDCVGVRSVDPEVYISAPSVQVLRCNFEQRASGSGDTPFIHIEQTNPTRQWDTLIRDCRFGSEESEISDSVAPRDTIVVGPLASGSANTYRCQGISIIDCYAHGAPDQSPSETKGRSFITLNQPVTGLEIRGGKIERKGYLRIFQENGLFDEQAFSSANFHTGRVSSVRELPAAGDYGAVGLEITHLPHATISPETVLEETTLLAPGTGSGWTYTAAQVEMTEVSSSYWSVKSKKVGSAIAYKFWNPVETEGDILLEIEARAATTDVFCFGHTGYNNALRLDDTWKTYRTIIPSQLWDNSTKFTLRVGEPSNAATDDEIHVKSMKAYLV